jgi:DNA-binding response OmpR family regulator
MSSTVNLALVPPGFTFRRRLRILLAEDNSQLRTTMATVLYQDGHSVIEARDGAELVRSVASMIVAHRDHELDLIICEQELPGYPGLSALAAFRAGGHSVPFVLMTGDEGLQSRAIELGAAILDRPLHTGALRAAVRRARATRTNDVVPEGWRWRGRGR